MRFLTDLDHHDHEALGALDHREGRGVGVARYVRQADDPWSADVAVTIIDEWQGRGLGTELLARLSDRAREENIQRFTALVAAENVAVAGLLRNACARLVGRESNTLEYEISLAPAAYQAGPGCPAGEMNGGQQGIRGRAAQVRDAIARLDVLGTQLRTRGWTAYLVTPSGRLASLVVQDPHERTVCSDIIAAPGGSAGDLWYWFRSGERIASAHAPGAAADAIIAARSAGHYPGRTVCYADRVQPPGPGCPLVLLPAPGLSRQSWDPVIPAA